MCVLEKREVLVMEAFGAVVCSISTEQRVEANCVSKLVVIISLLLSILTSSSAVWFVLLSLLCEQHEIISDLLHGNFLFAFQNGTKRM